MSTPVYGVEGFRLRGQGQVRRGQVKCVEGGCQVARGHMSHDASYDPGMTTGVRPLVWPVVPVHSGLQGCCPPQPQ
jgi:hypothetical protein